MTAKRWLQGGALLILTLFIGNVALAEHASQPQVTLHTSKGDIVIALFPDKAPVTVANFLGYANSGFYDNTIFHRVIRRFAVQGGGYNKDLVEKPNGDPIINEAGSSGLRNDRWTVAMARTADPDSARSQFFINMRMNLSLDARAGRDGYAVFGEVIDGQHVVRDIANAETHAYGGFDDLPVDPILIKSVTVTDHRHSSPR